MPKYVVATPDEIPPGERKIVDIGGRSIGVFNIEGEYFAIRNSCPHQGGPLCSGLVTGFLESSAPGTITTPARVKFSDAHGTVGNSTSKQDNRGGVRRSDASGNTKSKSRAVKISRHPLLDPRRDPMSPILSQSLLNNSMLSSKLIRALILFRREFRFPTLIRTYSWRGF